jgi:hypothetical protein
MEPKLPTQGFGGFGVESFRRKVFLQKEAAWSDVPDGGRRYSFACA